MGKGGAKAQGLQWEQGSWGGVRHKGDNIGHIWALVLYLALSHVDTCLTATISVIACPQTCFLPHGAVTLPGKPCKTCSFSLPLLQGDEGVPAAEGEELQGAPSQAPVAEEAPTALAEVLLPLLLPPPPSEPYPERLALAKMAEAAEEEAAAAAELASPSTEAGPPVVQPPAVLPSGGNHLL